MIRVAAPLPSCDVTLPEISLRVERMRLAKRLWRAKAEDGMEFGFELQTPLGEGDVVHCTAAARYVIRQLPEPVLEVDLALPASAAAGIGWAVGNLHLELMAEPARLLTPDEKPARQLLERLRIPYRETSALFRPGRFARGGPGAVAAQELGTSHRH
jgi:urease accessory protein